MNTPDLPFTDPGDPTRDGLALLLGIEPVEWGGGRSELALLVAERAKRMADALSPSSPTCPSSHSDVTTTADGRRSRLGGAVSVRFVSVSIV